MMFDVGCLFVKEDLEVTPIFGTCGLVLLDIKWQVEQSSVFDGNACISNNIFSVNGSSTASENSFQYSMRVNITAMGVVGSHCASNEI